MSIKNLKPTKNARTKQGYFPVTESVKYIGAVKKVIYRSSWEQRFCIWCERSPQVEKWASESVAIKYHCPIENRISQSSNRQLLFVKQKIGYFLLLTKIGLRINDNKRYN